MEFQICLFVGILVISLETFGFPSNYKFISRNKPHGWKTKGGNPFDDVNGRLPTALKPYHYNLVIHPNIYLLSPPFPFHGRVEIYLECVTPTDVITINSYELTIDESTLSVSVSPDTPGNPPTPVLTGWNENIDMEFLNFYLADNLVENERYVLSMNFSGTLRSDGIGIYFDSYLGPDGTTRYMVATQLEDIRGRMMFPGFDEPQMKATFNVTVVRAPFHTSLSNMPSLEIRNRPDGWAEEVFDKSPVMSLYLVCICVGDFQYVSAGKDNGYEIRIYSRPEMLPQMEFAASVAGKIQAWLETETGIPYDLPKLDHIILPSKASAMENWGLVTYGEQVSSVDPETSTTFAKEWIASFYSHEISHQWYGNLVTCDWWSEIWLNEGFATYYDYLPNQALGYSGTQPSQLDTQYFMHYDQRNDSDPVRKVVETAWEDAFYGSTYPKGGAMVRMLEGILTSQTFRRGLTRYLNTYQYGSANTDNLWGVLSQQAADDGITNPDGSALDMKERMDPWLNQMGFPLITITRNGDGTATASRSQYLSPANQIMETPSQWNYAWHVPLTVVTADSLPSDWNRGPVTWIDLQDTETVISGLPTDLNKWIFVNPKQMMYYRVNYDQASRDAIINQLSTDHTVFDIESRTYFIDDTFTLARTGVVPETAAMDATVYLSKETSSNPWEAALGYLMTTARWIDDQTWFGTFQSYVVGQTSSNYDQVGWIYDDTESPQEQYFRRDMIATSCAYGHPDCLNTARSQYVTYKQDPDVNSVDPNNLPTVLCTGIYEGDASDWQMALDQYVARRSSQVREERYHYLFGLSCTADTSLLDRFLTEVVSGSIIASRDLDQASQYLAANAYGADILWNYLDTEWDTVRPGIDQFKLLEIISSRFKASNQLDQLNSFISAHPAGSSSESNLYTQMLLLVEQNIDWLNNNGDALRDWLQVHQPSRDLTGSIYRMPVSTQQHWASVKRSYQNAPAWHNSKHF